MIIGGSMATIIERKKGTWFVRVFLGRDPLTGGTRFHNHTIRGTKKDAINYGHDIEMKRDKGQNVSASTTTLTDYLDEWLNHKAMGSLAPNTLEHYTEILNRYVKPLIGKVR
jgi:hypothetical protein